MKKRKHPGQDRHEFNNNPFTFLKKLARPASQPKPSRTPVRKTPADDPDLFLRAMSGTRRLEEESEENAPPPKATGSAPARIDEEQQHEEFLLAMSGTRRLHREPNESKPPSRSHTRPLPAGGNVSEEQKLFVQAVQQMGTALRRPEPEEEIGDRRRSSSGRMKQLKRGMIRISGELDLHGSLRDEALIKLRNFVAAAYRRGQKAVLVITGKGINSPEGPVLQGAVAEWLREKGTGMVAEFGPAPRDKGGSGAYVVFLKKPAPRSSDPPE